MKVKLVLIGLSAVVLAVFIGWGVAHATALADGGIRPDTWALGWNTSGCAKDPVSSWTGQYRPGCFSVFGYQVQPGPITESSGKFVSVGGFWFEKTSVRAVSPTLPLGSTPTPDPPPLPTLWRPAKVVTTPTPRSSSAWSTPLPTSGAPVPTPFVVRGATPTPCGPCSVCCD